MAASRPFHGEKGTTWEGGFRVPLVVRWPGVIEPGTIYNDIISHEDWMPTLLAAAGDPGHRREAEEGPYRANGKAWKVHLDGYNFMPYFKGEVDEGPRNQIFYFGQGGELNAVRWDDWKIHFAILEGNITNAQRIETSLADCHQSEGRSLRACLGGVRDVPALDGRQHVAVRAGPGGDPEVPRHPRRISRSRRVCRSTPGVSTTVR